MKLTKLLLALSLVLSAVACGDGDDDDPVTPTPDGSNPDGGNMMGMGYTQIEHLARPAIAEALLITNDFLAAYNGNAPDFEGVPEDAVNSVVGEAKTVLSALYHGVCLLNGALQLTPATGLKPAGMTCHAVGADIFESGTVLDGTVLTAASNEAASMYADKVAGQFLPDVMRIDTTVDSGYLTLCGDASSTPLLCGGRLPNEDTVDITYNYLLAGAMVDKGPYNQVRALVSDGVQFSDDDSENSGNVTLPDPTNEAQFHTDWSSTFPYLAPPM